MWRCGEPLDYEALLFYERGGLGIVPRSPITLRSTGRFLLRSSLNGLIDEDRFGFYSGVRLLGKNLRKL